MGSRVRSAAATAAGVLAALLLGVVVGVLGSFQHATVLTVGDVRLPVGVVLALAALLLAELVARDTVPLGLGPALVLVAWFATAVTFGTTRPEGDLVIPAGTAGEVFLYGGFLLGAVFAAYLAVTTARRRRPSASGDVAVGR